MGKKWWQTERAKKDLAKVEREFEWGRLTCCELATENVLYELGTNDWFHQEDRFEPIFFCPWCGLNIQTYTDLLELDKSKKD